MYDKREVRERKGGWEEGGGGSIKGGVKKWGEKRRQRC